MTDILRGIWQNAPVWVWPLFFVLLAIGLLAMRDRDSSIVPYIFYPLFGVSAMGMVDGLAHAPLNWIAFGAAFLLGAALAFRWQDGLILRKSGLRMRLRGDSMTLVVLMIIFFSNFANGVVEAIAPQVQGAPAFVALFASSIGACAGSFAGRALRVLTLGTRAA